MRDADLLGREEIGEDGTVEQLEAVSGKNVVVTGAAGSIGTALCRLLMKLDVRSLTMIDHSEFGLYQLARIVPGRYRLGDVRDRRKMIFEFDRADIVYHCAALKHVKLCEENPGEAVRTNILGSRSVHSAAKLVGAEAVLVSTDKAVEPINVMGITKMAAEALWQGGPIVRPVNVINSSGSVVPLFEELIRQGRPLPIHDRTSRFYMTDREVARMIVLAKFDINVPLVGKAIPTEALASRMVESLDSRAAVTFVKVPRYEKTVEVLKWPEESLIGVTSMTNIYGPALPPAEWKDFKELVGVSLDGAECRAGLFEWRDAWLKKLRPPA